LLDLCLFRYNTCSHRNVPYEKHPIAAPLNYRDIVTVTHREQGLWPPALLSGLPFLS
jgi:hypothetical protein